MEKVAAILSMLHEPPAHNSATRLFRQEPVLGWTLERLWMCEALESIAIVCWADQLDAVQPLASESEAHILCKDPRVPMPALDSISAARRWSDGWRGGLLHSCDFDLGFHAPWILEAAQKLEAQGVILIDPAAGLVDAQILQQMIDHAREHESLDIFFTQAPPGLGGALLRASLLEKLAAAHTHPGKLLSYLPEQPMRDPIGSESCVPIATPVARSTRTFRIDSERQVERLTNASVHLNGELVKSDAEDLINRLRWTGDIDALPREVTLEINTERKTSPLFWPGRHQAIRRPPIPVEQVERIADQLSEDVRVTLAGIGDPLLHPNMFEIIDALHTRGVRAIHVETDLLPENSQAIDRLADSDVDIVSVHLPAMSSPTYEAVMGVDRFTDVIENIRTFMLRRQARRRGTPILCPVFMKCSANLAEMEAWYDQWLRALGAAVISGPSDFAGLIPDVAVADMSPPKRKACNRIFSRMMILSDGRVVSCDQDVTGQQVMGKTNDMPLAEIWRNGFEPLRTSHRKGCWSSGLCGGCREWHRP